jgi:hypothetical protein
MISRPTRTNDGRGRNELRTSDKAKAVGGAFDVHRRVAGYRALRLFLTKRRSGKWAVRGQQRLLNRPPTTPKWTSAYLFRYDWGGGLQLSCRDPLSLSCARPPCGPRVSSAAWLRLGCLLRGTPTRAPSRTSRAPLQLPLPAPPRCPLGGTSYWGHPLGESNV